MERDVYQILLQWKGAHRRKPLVLDGARQTGKTWLLRKFGESEFTRVHYINFEADPLATSIFAGDLRPETTIPQIGLYTGVQVQSSDSLIVLDEIQACPRALTALKYFQEGAPRIAVTAAGSLLGLSGSSESYPVGKVTTVRLFPLSFSEFLRALDPPLWSHFAAFGEQPTAFPKLVHSRLWDRLTQYYVTGGMPEVVQTLLDAGGAIDVPGAEAIASVQNNLIHGYHGDFAKHAGTVNAHHLSRVFDAVSSQLSRTVDAGVKRFIFREAVAGARRYRDLVHVIDWLRTTGLVYSSAILEDPIVPLHAHVKESMFKLFLFDTGLLHRMLNVSAREILEQRWSTYKGYVAENFVAGELQAAGVSDLFTWTGRTSEIEFLLQTDDGVIPIEVKSGVSTGRAKSLQVYRDKYDPPIAVKVSGANYSFDGYVMNVPLYAAGMIPSIVR